MRAGLKRTNVMNIFVLDQINPAGRYARFRFSGFSSNDRSLLYRNRASRREFFLNFLPYLKIGAHNRTTNCDVGHDMRSFQIKSIMFITCNDHRVVSDVDFFQNEAHVANGQVFLRSSIYRHPISKYRSEMVWLFEGRYPCFKVRIEFRICGQEKFYMDCQLELPGPWFCQGLVCVLPRGELLEGLMSKDRAVFQILPQVWLYLNWFCHRFNSLYQ